MISQQCRCAIHNTLWNPHMHTCSQAICYRTCISRGPGESLCWACSKRDPSLRILAPDDEEARDVYSGRAIFSPLFTRMTVDYRPSTPCRFFTTFIGYASTTECYVICQNAYRYDHEFLQELVAYRCEDYRLQYISMLDCIVLLYWLSSVTAVLCSEC